MCDEQFDHAPKNAAPLFSHPTESRWRARRTFRSSSSDVLRFSKEGFASVRAIFSQREADSIWTRISPSNLASGLRGFQDHFAVRKNSHHAQPACHDAGLSGVY